MRTQSLDSGVNTNQAAFGTSSTHFPADALARAPLECPKVPKPETKPKGPRPQPPKTTTNVESESSHGASASTSTDPGSSRVHVGIYGAHPRLPKGRPTFTLSGDQNSTPAPENTECSKKQSKRPVKRPSKKGASSAPSSTVITPFGGMFVEDIDWDNLLSDSSISSNSDADFEFEAEFVDLEELEIQQTQSSTLQRRACAQPHSKCSTTTHSDEPSFGDHLHSAMANFRARYGGLSSSECSTSSESNGPSTPLLGNDEEHVHVSKPEHVLRDGEDVGLEEGIEAIPMKVLS
ncbi:hypothetical protein CTheo_5361 [Ceratobasidium theobromae]|uniref:Uncharacterized protein n=1 Tax=Ceratobasidium theobromae TaxID=1582974 RepID=A0A5N5QIR6_9AGAM|nr:hypothetical protein CTheo_5361 [Ceratobasidium theobromae]